MSGRFTLDVDPDAVEASGRQLGQVGESVALQGAPIARSGAGIPSGWRGAAADTATLELDGLGRELASSAPHFSTAQEALARLAAAYREGELTTADLNRRWEQAEAGRGAAVAGAERRQADALRVVPTGLPPEDRALMRQEAARAADDATAGAAAELASAQRALEAEFAELQAQLRRETTRAGSDVAAATVVPVPAVQLQAAVMTRALGGLFGLGYPTVDASATYADSLPLADLHRQLADPPRDVAALERLLAQARERGLHPTDYAEALKAYWRAEAFREAGIDPAHWRPELGAEANREIIEKVYEYYGKLYLDNPYMHWADMANMVGPSFAAGFFDLNLLQRSADAYARAGAPGLPPGMEEFAKMGAADIRWYEQKFLSMQKDIFLDQAPMHEAYEDGGLAAIEEMRAAGLLPDEMVQAWRDIDTGRAGDAAALDRGNTALLRREQFVVIGDSYDDMRRHPVTGEAMTFMMTLVGGPSIPGAQSYPEVFPLTVSQRMPGPERLGTPESVFGVDIPSVSVDNPAQGTVHVQTPLPDGNIADRQQRWNLIERDTLPAFRRLLREDPEAARALIASPVARRIEEQHMYAIPRVLEDVNHALTDWDVEFEQ